RINAGLDLFHRCLNEEMIADLRYFNSLELEVDSLISQLETQKTQFLNEIDRLSREYYYADHMNAILGLETKLLKSKMMSNNFKSVQKHAINLELELQQCKENIKNDKLFKVDQIKDFCKEREQYFKIQDLKAQLQDKGIVISELKKLIENLKGKSVDTKFEKSSFIRQPNAFKSQRLSVLGKPTTFSNSFVRKDFSKLKSVTQNNVSNDFSKQVTTQTLPSNKKSILKNTNVLAPGIPQLKSNLMEDSVMHNNSQGKKQEVEDQSRNVKLPKNKTSVTASNNSLNAKTLNVNSVFAMCDKCVLIDKHDMCVFNSVAKPIKRTVASESNQNLETLLGSYMNVLVRHVVGGIPSLHHQDTNGNLSLEKKMLIRMKSTCFIRDLKGNDLLIGSRGTDLYSITLQDTKCPNPICLMAKATSSQAWLWHRRMSHLNFDTINLLSKNDIVTLHAYFAAEGILHQTSVARTPEQNSVVERRNRTLVEAAQIMLSAAKVPLFFWAEAIATACFTQNCSLVMPRHDKTPYHIINNRKPSVKFFHIFGSLCYIVRDGENLDKMKEKGDECIFVGYSTQSRAYRVFNKRTRVIMESVHVNFDELPNMASNHISSNPAPE
nr:retrovirus-related Pol polyprotein from transposon TNT 1-94 [Tanacetum cinerariifolium]